MNTMNMITLLIGLSMFGGVKTGKLLGLDGGIYDELFEIDLDTGEAISLFSFEENPGGGGLAVSPDGGLFASFVGDLNSLVVIDSITGAVNIIGPVGFSIVSGIAFGPDGVLYGVDEATDQLLTIDVFTGVGTPVGPTGITSNQGLGFDRNGALYLVGSPVGGARLYTIDLHSGAATEVGLFGVGFTFAGSVEMIGATLYASAHDSLEEPYDVLVNVDANTGAVTKIGGFCSFSKDCPIMYGLAFLPGSGDGDRDGDVDEDDVAFFEACFGPLDEPGKSPYCAFLDSDKDGDLDCEDWEAFIPNWTEDTEPPTFEPCAGSVLCEGDANGDGTVDPLDSGYVQARFGCLVGTGDTACDQADANVDGVVDPLDVGYVLARFGGCE